MNTLRQNWHWIFFLASLVLYIYLLSTPIMLTAVDLGRHIANGRELLLGNYQILFENHYSFTMPRSNFVNHHWFFGVIVYVLDQTFGLASTQIFNMAVLSISFFLFFKLLMKNGGKTISSILAIIAIIFLSVRTEIRPESIGFLFLLHSLWQISKITQQNKINKTLIALLIIQQLFWVNIHISFIFGIFLFFLFYGCSSFLSNPTLNNKTKSRLLFLAITLILVSLINPNFVRGLVAPLNIFTDYGYSIVENQTLLFLWRVISHPILALYLPFAIFATLAFIYNFKKTNWYERVIFFVGLALGFLALRNLPIFAAFVFPITAKTLKESLEKLTKSNSFSFSKNTAILVSAQVYLLITVLVVTGTLHPSHHWRHRGIGQIAGETKAIEFLQDQQLSAPIFNNYDIGSYLIYYLYPKMPVFVDNRPEAYNSDFLQKIYIKMQEDPQVWEQVVDQYQIETVIFGVNDITPWAQQFLYFIEQEANWEKIYLDQFISIWVKKAFDY